MYAFFFTVLRRYLIIIFFIEEKALTSRVIGLKYYLGSLYTLYIHIQIRIYI